MNSHLSGAAVEVDSYALAIGFDADKKPVCLILSQDSLAEGGTLAMSATKASLSGYDLHLSSAQGSLVLKKLAMSALEAVHSGLPFVVLNPSTEAEHFIPAIGQ
ncbi:MULTISPECIES: hypothetical protein [Pseudomonas]|uniref:hypothetical protein n=1 Tax=Pseudomonas TaxID=286 RepID=UPI0014741579|nr:MULTISPECIES: hypothetical protein [Pseudomonas]MEC4242268.1 hypothetical protein [Pseudomonas sp. DSV-1]NNB33920.1 hypothetical protein [Pseudomonas fragi]